MRVLAHFPSLGSLPEGIWWDDPSGFQRFYLEGSTLERLGKVSFASLLPDVTFEDVCDAFEAGGGYDDVWVSLEIPEGVAPAEMLKRARLVASEA